MKKLMMTALIVLSVTALGAKKPKAEPVIPDVQT